MTPPDPATDDDLRARREASVARHRAALTHLFDEREDLHGVHPLADLVHESVRWTA